MAEKEQRKQEEPKKEDPSITVKYIGDSEDGTFIQGIPDGRGVFEKRGSQHIYRIPEEIKIMERLVKTNPNFKEVK
jgi:hypothetical protein